MCFHPGPRNRPLWNKLAIVLPVSLGPRDLLGSKSEVLRYKKHCSSLRPSANTCTADTLYSFRRAAVTKYHLMSSLNNGNVLSHNSGERSPRSRSPQGHAPLKALGKDLVQAPLPVWWLPSLHGLLSVHSFVLNFPFFLRTS